MYLGASPRGSLALYRTCQARALLDGRDFVIPDDVKELAYPTLGHRIIISPSARVKNVTAAEVVEQCLERRARCPGRAASRQPSKRRAKVAADAPRADSHLAIALRHITAR